MRAFLIIALGVAAAGCEESIAAGSSRGQLATLYSDSSRWCNKQKQCDVEAATCAERWPDRDAVRDAVGRLFDSQVSQCLHATLALDACALKLPCDEFAVFFELDYCVRDNETVPCCFDAEGAEVPCPNEARCANEELSFVKQCDPLEKLLGQ